MYTFVLLFSGLVLVSCGSDCLPEPDTDLTPPQVRILLDYTPRGDDTRQHAAITAADTSVTLTADRRSSVEIRYVAEDSSGLRSLVPGLTIQQTVGVGVERRHVQLGGRAESCPVARLERDHEVYGTGEKRVLILTAGAVNWTGARASVPPVTVRLE